MARDSFGIKNARVIFLLIYIVSNLIVNYIFYASGCIVIILTGYCDESRVKIYIKYGKEEKDMNIYDFSAENVYGDE